jgi:tetratricopeptide (TPR) repeat protein
MSDHCFICYSPADALEFAHRLKEQLEQRDPPYKAWMDKRDIRPGSDWDEQVKEAIRTCNVLLYVMSRDSVEPKSVCKNEWTHALKYKRPIVPLLLHKNAEQPFLLGLRQFLDFSGEFGASFDRLCAHLVWLHSPAGILAVLEDRLADARRDERRATNEEEGKRIGREIEELNAQIDAQKRVIANPSAAAHRTEERIAQTLEVERAGSTVQREPELVRFVNAPPCRAPDHFQDRYVETELVSKFLRNESQRVLYVMGRGGIGKTAMVCRTLKALEQNALPDQNGAWSVDGIVYLAAHKLSLPDFFQDVCRLLPAAAAQEMAQLYKNPAATIQVQIQQLLSHLSERRAVVLLDNFEDLIDPELQTIRDQEMREALEVLLRGPHHGVKVIITTRLTPRDLALVEPGRQMRLEMDKGLETPYAENILRAMDADGVVGLKDASDELLKLARERTGGFPRALEALFAILSVDRHTTLHELLQDTAQLLPGNVVEALVGEAFHRLDPLARQVMQALSVYGRPVPSAAVDFLLQTHVEGINSGPVLRRLVNAHLVRKTGDRYHLHSVDRAYAFSQIPRGARVDEMNASSEFTQFALLHRGADYFKAARVSREKWSCIDDLAAHLSEIDLRCEAEEWDEAARIGLDLHEIFDLWGHYRKEADIFSRCLPHISDLEIKARTQLALGWACYRLAEYDRALALLEAVLATTLSLRKADDSNLNALWLETAAWLDMGNCYGDLGRTNQAIDAYEKALRGWGRLAEPLNEAVTLNNLAFYLADLGQTRLAFDTHQQGTPLTKAGDNFAALTIEMANTAARMAEMGEAGKAKELCERALKEARKIQHRYSQSVSLTYLGDFHADEGDWLAAAHAYDEARQIAEETSNAQFLIHSLIGLATARFASNDLAGGRQAVSQARQYRVPRSYHRVLFLDGAGALRAGAVDAAVLAFTQARSEAEQILVHTPQHLHALETKGAAATGLLLCGRSNALEAAEAYRAARAINSETVIARRGLRLLEILGDAFSDTRLLPIREAAAGPP